MYTYIIKERKKKVKVNFVLPLPSASQFLRGVIGTENNWICE